MMRICTKHPELLGKRYKDGHCYGCVRERVKKWHESNREKSRAKSTAYYKLHVEERSVKAKEYRSANHEKIKEYDRARYQAKRETNREEMNAQSLVRGKAYRKRHPARHTADVSKRKAHKKQAMPAWANPEKINEFYLTAQTLGMHTGEFYHVDHIVPLHSKIVCGLHCEANLQVILASENHAKGNRYWPDMPSITYPA